MADSERSLSKSSHGSTIPPTERESGGYIDEAGYAEGKDLSTQMPPIEAPQAAAGLVD